MKLLMYVLVCAYLFARLDWAVVHTTRLANPAWLKWMHAHERAYANLTRLSGLVLCAPAMMLKPVFYFALIDVEAGGEEQESIIHMPKPDWRGFYNLPVRGEGYVFVSWSAWLVYWLVPSMVWIWIANIGGGQGD